MTDSSMQLFRTRLAYSIFLANVISSCSGVWAGRVAGFHFGWAERGVGIDSSIELTCHFLVAPSDPP